MAAGRGRRTISVTVLWVTVIAGLLLGMMILLTVQAVRKMLTPERLFGTMAVPLAVIWLMIFPAWSVPDAGPHFSESYRYANLLLGTPEDCGRAEDVAAFSEYGCVNPAASDWERTIRNFHWTPRREGEAKLPYAELLPQMNWYSFLNYLPQTTGLVLGRILGLGGVPTLYLARILTAAAFLLMAWRSIRMTPVGKYVFACIPLLPMSLMLGTSFSYDAMVLGTALGLTAALLRLRSGDTGRKALAEAVIWTLLAGGVKGGGNLLLLALLFSLPMNRQKRSWSMVGVICGVGVISLLLFDVLLPSGGSFQLRAAHTGNLYASWALIQPGEYLGMTVRAYLDNGIGLAMNMGGTYLAWLERTIPHIVILAWMALIGVFGVWETDRLQLTGRDRGLMAGIVLVVLIVLPAMMLSYTPVGAEKVEGLQGRYYSFLLPIFYLALTKWRGRKTLRRETVLQGAGICAGALAAVCVAFMLRLYCGR